MIIFLKYNVNNKLDEIIMLKIYILGCIKFVNLLNYLLPLQEMRSLRYMKHKWHTHAIGQRLTWAGLDPEA